MKPYLAKVVARMPPTLGAAIVLSIAGLLLARPSAALPSYARQTGQECAACHNGFPELTPYGRLFKMNGYVFPGSTANLPPLSVMLVPSFTRTDQDQPGGAAPHFGPNDNASFTGSLFYGGAIWTDIGLGAFIQTTYDHASRTFGWDNADIRIAQSVHAFDGELVLGATVNNNPTVTDPWNSTPAWGFPFVSSGVAPSPAAATLVEGGLAQQVLGPSVYGFWNRLVYAELGLYRTLSTRTLLTLGVEPTGTSSIKNVAPYWRVAVEPKWGRNSLEVGTFGLAATLNPGRVTGFGTDHTVDVGFDSQYQWLGERDSFSSQARWITENQTLSATSAIAADAGGETNTHNHLRSLNLKGTYWFQQTYGATLGYFNINGDSDFGIFGDASLNGSPNSTGWIAELDYMPFAHGGPSFWPWLNLKLGLQYTWYDKFNGGRADFDGTGRNSHDNNTLFAFLWLAF